MEGVWQIPEDGRPESARPSLERAVANLATRQYGVITSSQLERLGLGARGVRNRAAAGRLHRVHHGVYAVGHPLLAVEGRWMAAILACSPAAVLSHRSAAALWGLRPSSRTAIDVTAPGRAGRTRRGITVHTAATLYPADITSVERIPCTAIPRTLLDLSEVVDRGALERACNQADLLRILDVRAVVGVLAHAHGRRGAPALREIFADRWAAPTLTRSELEVRFLALCADSEILRPEVNVWIPLGDEHVEADFVWRDARLVVETDGHRVHGTRQAFERDRRRDQRFLLAGWRVVRFTWRQVTGEPQQVAATVRALLNRSPSV